MLPGCEALAHPPLRLLCLQAVHEVALSGGARQLRNDDMILQTTLLYRNTVVRVGAMHTLLVGLGWAVVGTQVLNGSSAFGRAGRRQQHVQAAGCVSCCPSPA